MAALGKADGSIVIEALMDTSGADKGIKKIQSGANSLSASLKKIGGIIGSVFATRAIVNFGKECVELGSNVAEVQNVVDVAFGDMVDKVEEFANSAIQNFGMSRLAAKKTASTYMAMAKGMGIMDESAAEMSITLAGLTGDIASFYNISQELADTKLKSVFTGETETLKDLGIVMTQTNLKAYALSQGITKSIESMTQAELVSLRYNFVLDQLALAQGDFARTSDSWANQTRILSMQWQEFMSIIGQSLITVLTPLVKMLNSIVSSMISMANAFNSFITSVFGGTNNQIQQTQASTEAISGSIGSSVDNQDALTDATKETAKAQKGLLAGFDEINKLSSSASGSGGGTTGGVSTTGLVPATQTVSFEVEGESKAVEFFRGIKEAFDKFVAQIDWDRIRTSAEGLRNALARFGSLTFDALERFWVNVLQPLGVWALNTAVPTVLDALNESLDLMGDLVEVLMGEKSIRELVKDITPFQTALLSIATALSAISAIKGIGKVFSAVTGFIAAIKSLGAVGLIGKLTEVITLAVSGAGTLGEAMAAVFGPGSIIAGIASVIGGAVLSITNFISMLKNGFNWANEALMLLGIALTAVGAIILGAPALVAGVVSGIVAAVTTAIVLIKEHWEELKLFFSTLLDSIKTAFLSIVGWINTAIIAPITKSFKNFINGLIGFVEGFVNFFVQGINKIIGAVNGLSFDIPDVLGGGTIGFNIPKVKEIQLPRLATGAVIPPNREFLAVLGDQRSGNNIEAPEALIRKIVREESGGANTDILRDILAAVREGHIIMVDKKVLGEVTSSALSNRARARGTVL